MKKFLVKFLSIVAVLSVSFVFGITGAWFTESRTASGIIKISDGISLSYTNLDSESSSGPYYLIFDKNDSNTISRQMPGNEVVIKNVSVAQTANSFDALLRIKISYGYRASDSGDFTYTQDPATAGISAITVSNNFRLNTTNNYYYYCKNSGASASSFSFADMQVISTTAVKLFGTGNTTSITIASTTGALRNICIKLVIEAVQATSDGFSGVNW